MTLMLTGASEVAELLGVSRMTVNRWTRKGLLPTVGQLDGVTGAWIYDKAAIVQLADERHATHAPAGVCS